MSVYEIVTNSLIAELEAGRAPWRDYRVGLSAPKNAQTKKPYNGINHLVLSVMGKKYLSSNWVTFKQAQALGGSVKKGEKACPVMFAMTEERDGKDKFVVKYYSVFNSQQCEGVEHGLADEQTLVEPIAKADSIINSMPQRPEIKHENQTMAFYRPLTDSVHMPLSVACSSEEYYSILFHELAHSTGHESRLARESLKKIQGFGSHEYSKEELVAEMTAAILSSEAGFLDKTMGNSAAYCRSWLKVLKNDRSMLIQAAGQAHKAAAFILGTK
jgi:antirestriction protein ArdC